MRSSAAFKINRVRAADDIKLRSLWDYVKKWTSVEASMRFRVHEGGFSEEIFTTLKELWTIALIFSANFYLNSKDRQIYALGPRSTTEWTWSSWRRRHTKLKQQGGSTESNALDIPIYHSPRKPGETLRDLEEDLSKTMAKLDRQLEFEKNRFDSENDDDREKALLMEEISRSGDNASLYCLLRVCTFSTPSRFTTFNNLVVDFYARKISRLEWFIRDRVTQSLVYELSRLEDELRIAKDIILSQRNVVSKIAEKFSAAVSAEGTPTPERTDLNGETGSNRKNEDTHRSNKVSQTRTTHRRSTHAVNTLPAKARAKHDTLLADLDKLADTVERLKRQAALLLEIKTEGQNTAIFVFTIVTVIFLPLSFVTGYFGMNTSDIRNLDQGQWIFWAVGLTLTLIILMVVWLISVKERGWRTSRQARRLQYAEW
ncbi:cora-like Mg2+ transporter protein-domain-containing protein [Xylaria intraflava]|nr:cora-like Mg2+ transporter protein-domain-containing protein [Xylaria intraflava]